MKLKNSRWGECVCVCNAQLTEKSVKIIYILCCVCRKFCCCQFSCRSFPLPLSLLFPSRMFNTQFDMSRRSFSNKTKPEGDGVSETSEDEEDFFFVTVEFLSWPIIRYKKEVLFGWVDLLVSFGGIAGLFLGFSLLSGIEIIYFYTMRTCCMFVKNRVRLKIFFDCKLCFITLLFFYFSRGTTLQAAGRKRLTTSHRLWSGL